MLLGRYARAMVDEAQGLPLLVFVDDAHLLDNGSAVLVHQMALTQAATVLATVRAGEVAARSGAFTMEGRPGRAHRDRRPR